jgi:hypothetical protein
MVRMFEIFGTRDRGQIVLKALEAGLLPFEKKEYDNPGLTHFPGCWHKHPGCATARLQDVKKQLMEIRDSTYKSAVSLRARVAGILEMI